MALKEQLLIKILHLQTPTPPLSPTIFPSPTTAGLFSPLRCLQGLAPLEHSVPFPRRPGSSHLYPDTCLAPPLHHHHQQLRHQYQQRHRPPCQHHYHYRHHSGPAGKQQQPPSGGPNRQACPRPPDAEHHHVDIRLKAGPCSRRHRQLSETQGHHGLGLAAGHSAQVRESGRKTRSAGLQTRARHSERVSIRYQNVV